MVKNLTLALTDDLRAGMDKYPEVRWSQVVAAGIRKYMKDRRGLTNLEGV